jgi:CcmD family protein
VIFADLTLRTSVKYVAAAYALVWILTLVYVAILRAKLGRLERELDEAERRLAETRGETERKPSETLVVH